MLLTNVKECHVFQMWICVWSLWQVTVAHINATAKNAADDKLRQSLRRFADTHTAPATVVLVSCEFCTNPPNQSYNPNAKIFLQTKHCLFIVYSWC